MCVCVSDAHPSTGTHVASCGPISGKKRPEARVHGALPFPARNP